MHQICNIFAHNGFHSNPIWRLKFAENFCCFFGITYATTQTKHKFAITSNLFHKCCESYLIHPLRILYIFQICNKILFRLLLSGSAGRRLRRSIRRETRLHKGFETCSDILRLWVLDRNKHNPTMMICFQILQTFFLTYSLVNLAFAFTQAKNGCTSIWNYVLWTVTQTRTSVECFRNFKYLNILKINFGQPHAKNSHRAPDTYTQLFRFTKIYSISALYLIIVQLLSSRHNFVVQ